MVSYSLPWERIAQRRAASSEKGWQSGWRLQPRLRDALMRIRKACLCRLQRRSQHVTHALEAAEAAFAATRRSPLAAASAAGANLSYSLLLAPTRLRLVVLVVFDQVVVG